MNNKVATIATLFFLLTFFSSPVFAQTTSDADANSSSSVQTGDNLTTTNLTVEGDRSETNVAPPKQPVFPANKMDPSGQIPHAYYFNAGNNVPDHYKGQGWNTIFFTPYFLKKGILHEDAMPMVSSVEDTRWWKWKKKQIKMTFSIPSFSHEKSAHINILNDYPDENFSEVGWPELEGFAMSPPEAVMAKGADACMSVGATDALFLTSTKFITEGDSAGVGGVAFGGSPTGSGIVGTGGGFGFAHGSAWVDGVPRMKAICFIADPTFKEVVKTEEVQEEVIPPIVTMPVRKNIPAPPEGISFPFNSFVHLDGQEEKVNSLADWIEKKLPQIIDENGEIAVIGFGDECGGDRANDHIAANRAKILHVLLNEKFKERGLQTVAMKTLSAGKNSPFVIGGESCNQAQNRKAVVVPIMGGGVHGSMMK